MSDKEESKEIKQEDDKEVYSEELSKISEDIKAARKNLVSKDAEERIQIAREEAKKEAETQFLVNQKIKEQEEIIKKLEEEKLLKEKEAAEKIEAIQKKVDELVSSKAPVREEDPFKSQASENSAKGVDSWTDEEIDKYEKLHAKAFFGPDYERMINQ